MLSALGKALAIFVGLLILGGAYLYVLAPDTAYELGLKAERSLAGLQEKQVKAGEFNIRYLSGGEGETLLLLHGFGADKDNWTRMAGDLTSSYHIVAPDLPGFGESDHPLNRDYTYQKQAERVHAFVQKLGLEKVHIAGNSMGGGIAGVYAATYPQATRSLTLVAPAGVAEAPRSALFQRLAAGGSNPLLPQSTEGFYALMDNWVFEHEPYIPAPIKYVLAQRAVERYPLQRDIFAQINEAPLALEQRLEGSPVPTLIIWGKQDKLLNVQGGQILADVIPAAKLVLMDDTGHAPMLERPRQTAQAIEAFVQGLPRATTAAN